MFVRVNAVLLSHEGKIVTTVDEKGKILNDKEFIEIRNSSEKNLEKMRNQLDELLGKMKLI